MNIKTFIAFLIIIFFTDACRYPCGQASANFALVNFTDTESDTIIFRRFARSGNFNELKDSFVISRDANTNFQRMHDTVLVLFSIPNRKSSLEAITSDYDYEIYLPNTNRLYKISNVEEEMQYGSGGGKTYCINPITSYRLNDKLIKGQRIFSIYLDK